MFTSTWKKKAPFLAEVVAFTKLLLGWDLGEEGTHSFTWASCRAGGATHQYMMHEDIARLELHGRWASSRTLKIYVQEAVAYL